MTAALLYVSLGALIGTAHLLLLRRNSRLYAQRETLGRAIGLQVLRLAGVAGVLVIVALHGALPLLMATLGVVVVRPLAMGALVRGLP